MYWSLAKWMWWGIRRAAASRCRKLRLSTCLPPRTASHPAYISPAHRMLRWEDSDTSLQQQVSAATYSCFCVTCWLYFTDSHSVIRSNILHFSLGVLKEKQRFKNEWVLSNVEKEKGGERLVWMFDEFVSWILVLCEFYFLTFKN